MCDSEAPAPDHETTASRVFFGEGEKPYGDRPVTVVSFLYGLGSCLCGFGSADEMPVINS